MLLEGLINLPPQWNPMGGLIQLNEQIIIINTWLAQTFHILSIYCTIFRAYVSIKENW